MTEPTKKRSRKPKHSFLEKELRKRAAERHGEIREKLAAAEAEAAAEIVRDARERLKWVDVLRQHFDANAVAVSRSIVRRTAGALASRGLLPRYDVAPVTHPSQPYTAWTDFEQIYVRYHHHDDIRLLAATLRGFIYHEGGHLEWTVPWLTLLADARTHDPNMTLTGAETSRLQHAWNGLEDQRMETAVVSDAPRKAAFFTPLIMTEHCKSPESAAANWPLLIWRRYLPKWIRDGARAEFVARNNEFLALQLEQVVDRYVKATDTRTMWNAVVAYANLMDRCSIQPDLPSIAGSHSRQGNPVEGQPDDDRLTIPIDPSMDNEGNDQGGVNAPGQKGQAGKGEGAGKGQGEDKSDQGGKGDQDATDQGGGSGSSSKGTHSDRGHREDAFSQEALDEALHKAEADRLLDSALDGDVEAFHNAKDNNASQIPPYNPGRDTNAARANEAEALAQDIVNSFLTSTMDKAPCWVEGQRTGILNVGRYMFRQPGDLEYFRRYQDADAPGFNLAVSVLLDYSGSMDVHMAKLAQAGYACKLACQELDIPCTVSLWDELATTLWDASETADFLPRLEDAGGTDPTYVLGDLPNQRYGKTKHLVLILTDGQWSFSGGNLARYRDEGTYIVGVGFSRSEAKAKSFAEGMRKYGASYSFGTVDLFDIPREMERMLIDLA